MVFCNKGNKCRKKTTISVTILILIDGFLQYKISNTFTAYDAGHNPYFNRWFSAIRDNPL